MTSSGGRARLEDEAVTKTYIRALQLIHVHLLAEALAPASPPGAGVARSMTGGKVLGRDSAPSTLSLPVLSIAMVATWFGRLQKLVLPTFSLLPQHPFRPQKRK